MIIRCSCCGKQAVSYNVSEYDKHCTILQGAKADFGNQVICGYCARDLDEYGLFPEEISCLLYEQLLEYDGKHIEYAKCLLEAYNTK